MEFTANAPVNIAIIKYWGKRDKNLNLPTNTSLSVTLRMDDENSWLKLLTRTTIKSIEESGGGDKDGDKDGEDKVILNGEQYDLNLRMKRCLAYIRELESFPRIQITSNNFFPTAAGLASSASGYAALVAAISGIVPLTDEQMSIAARLGSGSACRSLFNGFVLWNAGVNPDGSDSLAKSIFPENHWPALCCLVLVLSASEKKVPSSAGMELTTRTSGLFSARLEKLPSRITEILQSIEQRDFSQFGKLLMQDSNQFHAVCMDSYPPIFYLSGASLQVIETVHEINTPFIRAAYTFDAGPNAFVFCLENNVSFLKETFISRIPELSAEKVLRCRVGKGASLHYEH